MASHRPLVGSALNWQGQPHAQSQLTTSSPTILHLTLLMAKPLNGKQPRELWGVGSGRGLLVTCFYRVLSLTLSIMYLAYLGSRVRAHSSEPPRCSAVGYRERIAVASSVSTVSRRIA